VTEGQTLKVEKLEEEVGSSLELADVLMVADGDNIKVGTPLVDGGKVTATVKSHGRDDKVNIIKFRRRKHHMKRQGHRQYYTELEITGINA
jgi:large subunit ribosomal protein L21